MIVNSERTVVRPAAVAGLFYAGAAAELRREIGALFAGIEPAPEGKAPKAIIAPHAGYIYSGAVAAGAYERLRSMRGTIKRVLLLAPAHRAYVHGMALPEATSFMTPLGEVPLDLEAMTQLRSRLPLNDLRGAHTQEHAIEVHLPLLTEVLGDFKLVPLLVGEATLAQTVEVLDELWGGDETLIVVSTDLSHYHGYREAMQIDGGTINGILALRTDLSHEQACGATPLSGLLAVAKRRGMRIELIDRCNSGDNAGDRGRVVGYASFVLYENDGTHVVPPEWFPDGGGRVLLRLARSAIRGALDSDPPSFLMHAAWLKSPAAVFVTLRKYGELRGCIGSLAAHRMLAEDVRENAIAAATRDPRFPPLTLQELEQVTIEISLLTTPVAMQFSDEADALSQLKPGRDGVIFEEGERRATFLPQVWDEIPEPRDFLAQLKQKAGFPRDYWSPEVQLMRYGVLKFQE